MAEVITIDESAREVLRDLACLEAVDLMDFESFVCRGARDSAREGRDTAAFVFDLFEDLGWTVEGDRDRYEITLEPARFAAWLKIQRASSYNQEFDHKIRVIDQLLGKVAQTEAVA